MEQSDYCENWIGDRFFNGDRQCEHVSMKPMLAKLLREAFVTAVVESIPDIDDARSVKIFRDIYEITDEEWCSIDPGALARNIACRLFGTGGNTVRGVYSGNASPKEVFNACVANKEGEVDHVMNFLSEQGLDVRPIDSVEDLKGFEEECDGT